MNTANSDGIIYKTKNVFYIFFVPFLNLVSILNIFKKSMTVIADVFPILWTPKNMVRWTSKKSRLRGSFEKQHGKRTQALLKFAWQHLYHIYWSLWRQLTCKRSLLVICKISRLFPKTLSGNGKYSLFNRGNLTQRI